LVKADNDGGTGPDSSALSLSCKNVRFVKPAICGGSVPVRLVRLFRKKSFRLVKPLICGGIVLDSDGVLPGP